MTKIPYDYLDIIARELVADSNGWYPELETWRLARETLERAGDALDHALAVRFAPNGWAREGLGWGLCAAFGHDMRTAAPQP